MSIAYVVTRGYGTGTLAGDVEELPTRGYSIGEETASAELTGPATLSERLLSGQKIYIDLTGATWVSDS